MNNTILSPGEGKQLNLIGDPFTVKATGEDNGGWSFFEATVMPGSVVPEHKHDGFDEAFYILEGELEMQMDGQTAVVTPGYFINIKRGSVHGLAFVLCLHERNQARGSRQTSDVRSENSIAAALHAA